MGEALDALVSVTILGIWFAAIAAAAWPRQRAVYIAAALVILPAAIGLAAEWLNALSGFPLVRPFSFLSDMQMPCGPLPLSLDRMVAKHGYVIVGPLLAYPFRLPLVGVFLPPLVNIPWALANYWLVYWAILRQRPLRRAARKPA